MTSHLDPELGYGDRSAGLNAEKLIERLRPGAVSRLNSANVFRLKVEPDQPTFQDIGLVHFLVT